MYKDCTYHIIERGTTEIKVSVYLGAQETGT